MLKWKTGSAQITGLVSLKLMDFLPQSFTEYPQSFAEFLVLRSLPPAVGRVQALLTFDFFLPATIQCGL